MKNCKNCLKELGIKSRRTYCNRNCYSVYFKKIQQKRYCILCKKTFIVRTKKAQNRKICSLKCRLKHRKSKLLKCKICNRKFKANYKRKYTAKTCSRKCKGILQRNNSRKKSKCKFCKKTMLVKRFQSYKKKFCSRKCAYLSRINRYKCKCKQCNKVFMVQKNRRKIAKFCSNKCNNISRRYKRIKAKCYTCNKTIKRIRKNSKNIYCNNYCFHNRGDFSIAKQIEKQCTTCKKKLLINACVVRRKDKKEIKTYHCSRKCLFQYQHLLRSKGPNKQERKIAKILRGTKFYFVGNFKFSIGGKYPDFISKRRMKVIEFFGEHWHKPSEEKTRIAHFKKHGYKCLVIWMKDLKHFPSKTRKRILKFAS